MFESCNILPIVLVGVCCSRVSEKKLKLERSKIIVAVIISIGILMFEFFNPEAKESDK